MELLLLLTYAGIAIAIFKIFRIPANAFTLLTAVLGGLALIGALLLGMNYNHPFSNQGRFYFVTTPITPTVAGRVVEVPVQPNVPVKAGDVLFRIEPERYENAVKAKEAALADAQQVAEQLKAASSTASNNAKAAVSARDAALDVYSRSKQLIAAGAISQAQFKQTEERYFGARSQADAAQAEAQRAFLEASSAIEGVNTDVARIKSELDTARFDLEQTVVRAPTDGVVLQLFLRPGMYAVPLPLRPVMVFMSAEPPRFVAAFLQNSSQRITEGAEAEVILPAVPGRFFKARVLSTGAYIPQGQLQPSGTLVDPEQIRGEGRVIVQLHFEDDLSKFQIVPGSIGDVAIYTHHMHHLAIMRKILLRMKSWTNFIFGDGHAGGSGGGSH
ncbi:MAG: biotin/lipoyl-binding protein [Terrimicrobiaceae bacterium]|nr:biotin/lipoyl-binding protein [Terrimicrobiaceae bacterium]